MIAKLIVWGPDRNSAARRLRAALDAYEVVGVTTNLELLRAISKNPAFLAGDLDTGFIARHIHAETGDAEADPVAVAAAALAVLDGLRIENPADPWDVMDSFRLNGEGAQEILLRAGEAVVPVRAMSQDDRVWRLRFGRFEVTAGFWANGISVDGVMHRARVVRDGDALTVILRGRGQVFSLVDPLVPAGAVGAGDDRVVAPIPAKVTHVLVRAGDEVVKGAPLVVLEAMKMEITLTAPRDGVIDVVRYVAGDMVEEGTELIHFT